MEQDDYVEGLTGEEIINDILDQVETKLRGDCNLRETDSYTGGYDGRVEVHLNLHGLDVAEIKHKIVVSAPASATYAGTEEAPAEETTIDVCVDIPLEPRVNLVRERSEQDVPTLGKDETGATVVRKRHYARRNAESNSK